jgi:hypothetical protein
MTRGVPISSRTRCGRWRSVAVITAAAAVGLGACRGDDGPATSGAGGGGGAASGASASGAASVPARYDLAAVCPSTVVIQTGGEPQSGDGGTYQLLGPNPDVDPAGRRVSGPLVGPGGIDTGVRVEIRAGGPAVGSRSVTSLLYSDPGITLGSLDTDEQVQFSATRPTTVVFAPLERSPQMVMWDPRTYPAVRTIADLGRTDATVRYHQGAAAMDYLTGSGVLQEGRVDGSDDGGPAAYVAAGGKEARQGSVVSDPYVYAHETAGWNRSVRYQLVADTGWDPYAQALGVRSDTLDTLTPCLTRLVPILQQAQVDFLRSPAATTALVLALVGRYDDGWTWSQGDADYALAAMRSLGIVGTGSDATLGNLDPARLQTFLDLAVPVLETRGTRVRSGLKPSDLADDEFIDPTIGLP